MVYVPSFTAHTWTQMQCWSHVILVILLIHHLKYWLASSKNALSQSDQQDVFRFCRYNISGYYLLSSQLFLKESIFSPSHNKMFSASAAIIYRCTTYCRHSYSSRSRYLLRHVTDCVGTIECIFHATRLRRGRMFANMARKTLMDEIRESFSSKNYICGGGWYSFYYYILWFWDPKVDLRSRIRTVNVQPSSFVCYWTQKSPCFLLEGHDKQNKIFFLSSHKRKTKKPPNLVRSHHTR